MTTEPRPWLRPLRDWSLGSRMMVLFLGLLLVIQALAFFATQTILFDNARRSIKDELAVGERALTRLLEQSASRLAEGSRVLSADFGFRQAVASGDLPTIQSALENQGERIGASVAALLDTSFEVRVSAATDNSLQSAARRLGAQSQSLAGAQPRPGASDEPLSLVAAVGGAPMQLVLVPLKTPLLSGWVLMGFSLDPWLARDLRRLTALDVAVLVAPDAGAPWQAPISSTSADVTADLLRAGLDFDAPPRKDARERSTLLADVEFGWRSVRLSEDGGTGPSAVQAVLLRSIDDAVRPYERLRWLFAGVTVLGMLAFAIGGALTTRRITRPVHGLLEATRRVGAGDYRTPLPGTTTGDEIGQLALAFEQMRGNIAEQQTKLHRAAYEDALTGLPNRLRFGLAVQEAIQARQSQLTERGVGLAVLVLNLDRFKHVNDVLGYAFGDRVLQAVAGRLRDRLGEGDVLARLGADEFALLLPCSEHANALRTAHAIAAAFGRALSIDAQTIDLGAGIGIACWPEHAVAAESLLSRAEVAMRSAKRKASGPQLYDSASDSTSTQTLSLLSELRRAVDQNELRLFLQPKVAFDDGRLVGAEALVRWKHPTRGMVPPMDFIPFAEETGFVRHLTLWVFEATVQAWKRLAERGSVGLRISVNLSTHDLLDTELPEHLRALLDRHGAPAAAFCLEITESAIMDDPQRAQATLERLRASGFKLSIDDFGTGYSSLAYLKRLPVDELKIDKSFVIGMERDADDAKIVRSTIDLAHNLGLTVVAEGVENAAIWNLLHRQGCDEGQGYHMSRPMPADDFAAWAERWNDRSATGWGGLEVLPLAPTADASTRAEAEAGAVRRRALPVTS